MEINQLSPLPHIILFDDEEANIRLYSGYFKGHFKVSGFQNPHHYARAMQEDVSAILIDVKMPVMDGFQLFEKLQQDPNYNGCPFIFISASRCEEILHSALSCGGQDILTKAMTKDEMVLRVKNKINFFKANRQIFRLGNIQINVSYLQASYKKNIIEMTLTEMKIMKFLIKHYPRLSTRDEINNEVWPGQKVMPTTLNTHLSNLRSKFPDWEYEIMNIKGKGIKLLPKK